MKVSTPVLTFHQCSGLFTEDQCNFPIDHLNIFQKNIRLNLQIYFRSRIEFFIRKKYQNLYYCLITFFFLNFMGSLFDVFNCIWCVFGLHLKECLLKKFSTAGPAEFSYNGMLHMAGKVSIFSIFPLISDRF